MNSNTENWLITGASGFLGGRLLKDLSKIFPNHQFTGSSRSSNRQSEFSEMGLQYLSGDLNSTEFCKEITKGKNIIIHCAALSSPWGNYSDFFQANVIATENLLSAAKENGVHKFIYISTAGVYHTGKDVLNAKENKDESDHFLNHYISTKIKGEQFVLDHNSEDFQTISFRPRILVGAEDTVVFPRLIRAYKENKLVIIGNGKNLINTTSIENITEIVRCALNSDKTKWGKAYNITDGTNTPLWELVNKSLLELGYKPITKNVPAWLVYSVAWIMEKFALAFTKKEPAIVPYTVIASSKTLTVNIDKAKRELGYHPVTTHEESIIKFVEWYKNYSKSSSL